MQADPMTLMKLCDGYSCESVPDEVYEAVYESLNQVPRGDCYDPLRDARAEILAPLMARRGWRFCPCYPLLRSRDHARIFELVHTDLANQLAHKAALRAVA